MSGKKKNKVTVPLDTFLSSDTSWAAASLEDDEDDDFVSDHHDPYSDNHHEEDNYDSRRSNSDRYDRRGNSDNDRKRNRYDAPQKPIPDHGPWVAFVGNISFDVTEDDIGEYFSQNCEVESVRIRTDRTSGNSKGYGYITFADVDSLKMALGANGVEFCGRQIRVDVADAQTNTRSNRGNQRIERVSKADSVDRWERGVKKPVVERPRREQNYDREPRRDQRRDNRYEREPRQERKPLNIQPRTSNEPIGGAAKVNKSNPFGEAKPRDELEFQKKKEEERKRREQEAQEKRSQSNFNSNRGKQQQRNKGGQRYKGKQQDGGRDFGSARDNMGKVVTKSKEPKKFKAVSVNKETTAIKCKNIYSALKEQE